MVNMKLFYVMHYDLEDPTWAGVEFMDLDKKKCKQWIKENFWDYYEGDQPDWDKNPTAKDLDDYTPDFIKDFDEDEILNELRLEICSYDHFEKVLGIITDKDKINEAIAKSIDGLFGTVLRVGDEIYENRKRG